MLCNRLHSVENPYYCGKVSVFIIILLTLQIILDFYLESPVWNRIFQLHL